MKGEFSINGRHIGQGHPAYIIAEMSANHGQEKKRAIEIIHAMKESGADAVKLQTYTPDTITLDCDNPSFTDCLKGTIWEGKSLYELYGEAYTPWEWHAELKREAETLGMDFFSTPFDVTAVDFLESLHVPAYKVASFEIVHLPLIARIAKTGKPMILSTGMATRKEIADAIAIAEQNFPERVAPSEVEGRIALLKCTSAYPAKIEDANLKTIPDMGQAFGLPVGLSDHTMGAAVPVTAVTLGACIIEKHFVFDRQRDRGPDSAFSMEPHEFKEMVNAVRAAGKNPSSAQIEEKALGKVHYGPSSGDKKSLVFRPSIFVVEDIKEGEPFTEKNIRIIRPGYGLAPKELKKIIGKKAAKTIEKGIPMAFELVQ